MIRSRHRFINITFVVATLYCGGSALAETFDATTLSLLNDSSAMTPAPQLSPSKSFSSPHYTIRKRPNRKPAQALRVPILQEDDDGYEFDPRKDITTMAPQTPVSARPLTFTDQMRDIVLGGTHEEVENYKKALKPWDNRLNNVEIGLAPIFVFNDSKGANWARTYQTHGLGLEVEARDWISPTFAFSGRYLGTFPNGEPRGPAISNLDNVQDRWLDLGFRFRRFYGSFYRPTHIILGVDYDQYQHITELHDGDTRNAFTTYGPRITVEALLPMSRKSAFNIGIEFIPFGFENEQSNTNPQIVSGAHSQTMRVGLSLGPEFSFDRSARLFFKVSGQLSQSNYDSTTSYASPSTGAPVIGENITNTFLIFELGYVWGT